MYYLIIIQEKADFVKWVREETKKKDSEESFLIFRDYFLVASTAFSVPYQTVLPLLP